MAWTKEMVEQLRQMWLEGLTANEIAKKIGVSKNSIVGKVHRLCLQARPSPIKKKESESVEDAADSPMLDISLEQETQNITEDTSDTVNDEKTATAVINVDIKSENIKLVDLDSHTCRWPIGDPREDDFCFCGKKIKSGQTYCEEHAAIAYVKPQKK